MRIRKVSLIVALGIILNFCYLNTFLQGEVCAKHNKINNSVDSFVRSKYSASCEFYEPKDPLMTKQVEKQATSSQQIESTSRGASRYEISKEDFDILARISASEAADGTLEQKKNVVQIVLNRVKDERFPNNIHDVVFAEKQFSVVTDGSFYRRPVRDIDLVAVQAVLENPTLHETVFFQAEWCDSKWFRTLRFVFSDGIHKFYVTN